MLYLSLVLVFILSYSFYFYGKKRALSLKFKKNEKEIVAASDAFFPFVDGIEKLIQSGVSAVIQPRGSIRDKEIIKFADKTNTILIFSKTRHFRH